MLKPMLELAAGRTMGFAVTFFIPVVLVRVLDVAEFGTYKQIFLVYVTLLSIAQIGMAECLYFFLPSDPARAGRFVANSLIALVAAGVATIVLLGFTSGVLAGGMDNPEIASHWLLLGLFVALTIFSTVTEIVMITQHRHRLSATTYVASDLVRAVCLIVPALIWRNVHSVMVGAVVYGILRACLTIAYTVREFGRQLRPEPTILRTQLAYALPFAVAVFIEIFQGNLHQFVVAHRYDIATFAIYSVGCLQIPLVDFIATGAGSVLMVKMGEKSATTEREARLEIWHEAVRKLALLLFPLVALLLACGHQLIVLLYTERFRASVPIFLVASTTIALAALPTDSALRTYRQTGFLVGMNVIRLIAVAIAIGPFMAFWGLPGAAASVVLGTAVAKTVALVRLHRLLEVRVAQLLPWRSLGATLAAASVSGAIAWAAKNALSMPTFVSLAVAGLVCVGAYVAAAKWLGLVEGNGLATRAT